LKDDPVTASIPVVLLTARSSLGDMVFGIQMGADDYVAKPYDIDLLCLRIAALLRMWRIRADLQVAQARLDEMELIATSAGTLVHSIKNPLVIIRNYVKWVRDALQRSEYASVYKGLEKIDLSAAAITRIIDGLRRAHIERPKMSWVQLQGLLDVSFLEVTAAALPSGLKVIKEYEDGLSHVVGDLHQLRMAFMNLVANALEAMPEGGVLALRIYTADSNGIQVEIEDSGSGIREDIKGNLFKPFVTTKAHGTGLGLWTAKRIIEMNHGGRLTIDSILGKGTIVRAWLPTGHHPNKPIREALPHE
jgi:signal transduction histidine kinase